VIDPNEYERPKRTRWRCASEGFATLLDLARRKLNTALGIPPT
jgi:hypothetical protein